mmetsp:Transcript_114578/g.286379  ORF Transcript_114578/g.286379 Transcript_114578/m.286379 type:complete len:80 (+) Transcript_114578:1211-1450(+)
MTMPRTNEPSMTNRKVLRLDRPKQSRKRAHQVAEVGDPERSGGHFKSKGEVNGVEAAVLGKLSGGDAFPIPDFASRGSE